MSGEVSATTTLLGGGIAEFLLQLFWTEVDHRYADQMQV